MKHLSKIVLLIIVMIGNSACQDYTTFRDVEKDKSLLIPHNLIVFDSQQGNEGVKLKISYSVSKNKTENKIVEKIVTLPCVLEMEDVVMKYDSLNFMVGGGWSKESFLKGARRIKQNYSKGGSDYFRVENLSDKEVEFAIIGKQSLVLENNNIIKSHPNPIYKGVPLLYLLKPDLSPNRNLFVIAAKSYKEDNGLISSESFLKKVNWKPNSLGEFDRSDLPFSATSILDIYRTQSEYLYLRYFQYSIGLLGINSKNIYYQNLWTYYNKKLYGKIQGKQTLTNKGELPIVALDFQIDTKLEQF